MPVTPSPKYARRAAILAISLATVGAVCPFLASSASADPAGSGVVIEEVYGGGGNSGSHYQADYVELFNPTDASIDLTGWTVQYRSATGTSVSKTSLSGSIAAHSHYLVQESGGTGGDQVALPTADATGTVALGATGGVVILASSTTNVTAQGDLAGLAGVVDAVGWGSSTTSYEGSAPAPATDSTTAVSRTDGADTDHNDVDFTKTAPDPLSSASDGGGTTSPPTTVSIAEIRGTTPHATPLAGQTVTTEGVVTAAYPTGGLNGFYIQTGGTGGATKSVALPAASDAVFVYTGSAPTVTVGASVRVTGTVAEHNGETEIDGPTVTELASALAPVVPNALPWSALNGDAEKEAYEGELFAPQGDWTVTDDYDTNYYGEVELAAGDTPLRQPTDAGTAGSATARATAADNDARAVILDDGSSWTYSASSHSSNPLPWLTPSNPVRVGSAVTFHAPVVLAHDPFEDYAETQWEFQPTQQVAGDGAAVATFSDTRPANQRPADVGGDIRLATFNVENYFPETGAKYTASGLGTCTYYTDRQGNRITVNTCTGTDGSPGPRGAADDVNFGRQQEKIVTGINRLDASIVSLEEIENSAKFGEPRDTALAGLVAALNATAGSPVWDYVKSPGAGALPPLDEQDVIRIGFIYKPADVTPVGTSTVLTGDSGGGQPFSIAREPLAQGFKKTGASDADAFLVVANHFKSKGADSDPLYPGDTEDTSSPAVDQGAFNATRVREAQDVATFASHAAAALGTNRVFLVGDFNAYTDEDPLETLYADGYTDLGSTLDPSEQTYSYDGLEGSLDHVLANAAARAMVTGADVWQINAQESVGFDYSRYNYNTTQLFDGTDPFAASDHDPVIVGLDLPATPTAPAWKPSTIYDTGDTVSYDGSIWQALWWTQNQAPGDPYGPWEQMATAPDGTALWTASRIFVAGDKAEYQGKTYVAQWWTRDQVPGDPYGPWKLVNGSRIAVGR